MAQQSWLGNIWDAITGRDKEPAGNGLMSSLSEDPEAISWGNLRPVQRSVPEYARNLGETWANMGEGSLLALRGAVADVPAAVAGAYTAFGPEAGLRRPGEGRMEAFGRGFTEAKQAQPIGLLREGYEELSAQTQPFSFGDMSQQDRMMAREMGAPLGLAEAAAIPTAARAVRGAANMAAEAVERSPVGQGILAMQEQRGMTPDGILGVSRMADEQPSRLGEAQPKGLLEQDYRGAHMAPMRDSGAPAYKLTGLEGEIYPEDIYSSNGFRYYADHGSPADRESYNIATSLRNRPNATVTIYRAVPSSPQAQLNKLEKQMATFMKSGKLPESAEGDPRWYDKAYDLREELRAQVQAGGSERLNINPGDWVAVSRKYAQDHGESVLRGDYEIISKKVKAKDIYTSGDSINEWGYDPD